MFDYTERIQSPNTQPMHKGYRVYTKIEDIAQNKTFAADVPSIFTHLRNIKHLPEEEQKYILSLLDSDIYDDLYRFVRTRVTPNIIIELYELHYPFEIVNDKDLLELCVIFQLYSTYLQENLTQYEKEMQSNDKMINKQKNSIMIQQIKHKLSTIKEIADTFQRKSQILISNNPSLRSRFPLLDNPTSDIEDLLKTYENISYS